MFDLSDIRFVGAGLKRPECVLAHSCGVLVVPDWTDGGGVSVIVPGGRAVRHLARGGGVDGPLRPNGIALEDGGSVLLAHLGAARGGVFRLHPDRSVEPVLQSVDGAGLPPTNFVISDGEGGLWVSVSTRRVPRALGYRADVDDGFIVHVAADGASRIAADGLGYTNECMVCPSGDWLYVNETFARRLSRFALPKAGHLGRRETVCEFAAGTFPDGLAFDAEGNAWITSIVSNRIVRVDRDGHREIWLEDVDADHLAAVEAAYRSDAMGRPHLDNVRSQVLQNISNLAFGGPDLRTGYLGCLLGERIATVRMPVAGHRLAHWNVDIEPLMAAVGVGA